MSSREKQSREELEQHLVQQINFLINSSKLYDEGNHAESKRLALTLRILFHETRNSKSLLSLLSLKDISWINTAGPYDPASLVSYTGLISIKFDNSSGRVPWLIPRGTPTGPINKLPFENWWEMPVIVAVSDTIKHSFSRKDLILNVVDTDGGAHVDSDLPEDYTKLSRRNSIGYTAVRNGSEYPMINPELPCMRQISHEVLLTLEDAVHHHFEQSYKHQVGDAPYGISKKTGPPAEISVKMNVMD